MLRGRRGWVALILAACLLGEIFVFVTPPTDAAKPSGVVIILGPSTRGDRYAIADRLASRSRDLLIAFGRPCPRSLDRRFVAYRSVKCFDPRPRTTQGEARYASGYARQTGAHNITIITTADQVTRARLRFGRCWSGGLSVLAAPLGRRDELKRVPYENGALLKALFLQRGC